MAKCKCEECEICLPAWLAAFGDLMSLLLCFFVLLLSMATMDAVKVREAVGSFKGTLGILPGSELLEASEFFAMPQNEPVEGEESSAALDHLKDPVAEINQIFASMNQEIATIEESENGFSLRMPSSLLFEKEETAIRSEDAFLFIKRVAMIIKKMPNSIEVSVRGHTDNIPPESNLYADNWELSSSRAISVVKEFLKEGIRKNSIHASGFSDSKPIASNVTEEGRKKNRRVEIYFYSDKKNKQLKNPLKLKKSILDG
jgi:chemotaxis protein MotB